MAERTPKALASYDAVATTPRPPTPPTTTGLPRSEGLSRCSTAAKKGSRSRGRTEAVVRTQPRPVDAALSMAANYRHGRHRPVPAVRGARRAGFRPQATFRPGSPQVRRRPAAVVGPRGEVGGMTTAPSLPTTLTARSPEDLLAVVPVVLGFFPQDSIVMLTLGPRTTFHARVDLPRGPDAVAESIESLLEPAARHRVRRVVFVVYSDDDRAARSAARPLRRAFQRAGIDVVDTLRADASRWYSLAGSRGAPE